MQRNDKAPVSTVGMLLPWYAGSQGDAAQFHRRPGGGNSYLWAARQRMKQK